VFECFPPTVRGPQKNRSLLGRFFLAIEEFGEQTVVPQTVISELVSRSKTKVILDNSLRFSKFLEVFFRHCRSLGGPVAP
jgi:hypothetical protein